MPRHSWIDRTRKELSEKVLRGARTRTSEKLICKELWCIICAEAYSSANYARSTASGCSTPPVCTFVWSTRWEGTWPPASISLPRPCTFLGEENAWSLCLRSLPKQQPRKRRSAEWWDRQLLNNWKCWCRRWCSSPTQPDRWLTPRGKTLRALLLEKDPVCCRHSVPRRDQRTH